MILILTTIACTLIVEKLRESSQNTEEPEQTVEEDRAFNAKLKDTAPTEPAMEPSQPTSEPEAVEPSEPAMEPSQPTSEPADTAEVVPCK